MTGLLGGQPSVYHQLGPGYERRFVRCQVQDAVCNLVGGTGPAHRRSRHHLLEPFLILESPVGHGGIREAWMHRVDPDVLFGVLDSGRLGEQPNGPLGGMIGSGAGNSDDPVDGRDVYDGAAANLTHLWDSQFGP